MKIEVKCGSRNPQLVRAVIPTNGVTAPAWTIDGVEAQSVTVTRDEDGDADSVELVALVPNKNPGGLALYDVYMADKGVRPPLLQNKKLDFSIVLKDAQGQEYVYESLSAPIRVFSGPYKTVVKYNGYLSFTIFPGAATSSLMGVTIFVTRYRDQNWVQFDLEINNAIDRLAQTGSVYFKSLKLEIEEKHIYPMVGSKRSCDASQDGVYHIVAETGADSYFPQQATLHRRFIVADQSLPQEEVDYLANFGGLGFCLDWDTSYGPAKTGIGNPTEYLHAWGQDGLGYNGREAWRRTAKDELASLKMCLENNVIAEWVGVYSHNFGPFHPFYLEMQGAHGGFGISHYSGYRRCSEDYAAIACVAHMTSERQRHSMYMQWSNEPKTYTNFYEENKWLPLPFRFAPYDYPINGVPAWKIKHAFNLGEANTGIDQFENIDAQHQCRLNKPREALILLGNDMLAKREQEMMAEINLLYLDPYGFLRDLETQVDLQPGRGGVLGRGMCWPIEAIMSYYVVAPPRWRNRVLPWIKRMSAVITKSQMPTGWNNRVAGNSQTQVIETADLPREYDVAQTFEVEFEDWVKRCLAVALPKRSRIRKALNQSIVRSANSFFHTQLYSGSAYRWYIAVGNTGGAPFTQDQLRLDLSSQGDEVFHGWFVLNHAIMASRELGIEEGAFVNAFLTYRETGVSIGHKVDILSRLASETWNDHWPQAAGIIRTFQQ